MIISIAIAILLLFWSIDKLSMKTLTISEIINILGKGNPQDELETVENIQRSIDYHKYDDWCCEGKKKGFNIIIEYYYIPRSEEDDTSCRMIRHLPECKHCGHIDDGGDSEGTRIRVKI